MTDYEKLKKCFDEIGIEYKVNESTISDEHPNPYRNISLRNEFSEYEFHILFDDRGNISN